MTSRSSIIFIDWYRTLSCDLFWQRIQKENPTAFEKIEKALFQNTQLINEWMTGCYSSEEICDHLEECSGISSKKLFSELQTYCSNTLIRPEIIKTIEQLRLRHHIIIVTDNMDCFSRFTVPALHIQNWTDAISNSSQVKRLKNEHGGKTFQDIADQLHIPMAKTFCIDDNPETCKIIRSLGGTAMQTTGESQTLEILTSINRTS